MEGFQTVIIFVIVQVQVDIQVILFALILFRYSPYNFRYLEKMPHSGIEEVAKPQKCEVCGKQFISRRALANHNRAHIRMYFYLFNPVKLASPSYRNVHNEYFTAESERKKFKCEVCDQEFTLKHLRLHRRTHLGEFKNNMKNEENESTINIRINI